MNLKKGEFLWTSFILLSIVSKTFTQTSSTTSTTDSSDASVGYIHWLNSLLRFYNVPENIAEDSVNQLQIPFDLEIRTDSQSQQCVPGAGPYCYPSGSLTQASTDNACLSREEKLCHVINCAHEFVERPLDDFASQVNFIGTPYQVLSQNSTFQDCGIEIRNNSLEFEGFFSNESQPFCGSTPSISLNFKDSQNSYTLSFELESNGSGTEPFNFLAISGSSLNKSSVFQTTLYVEQGEVQNTSTNMETKTFQPQTDLEGIYLLAVSQTHVVLYFNGEMRTEMTALKVEDPVAEIVVAFGSPKFRGTVRNVQLYSVAANTNEIYVKFTSQSLASHVLEPQCKCPREYGDSFNLLKESDSRQISDNFCTGIFSQSTTPNTTRYSGSSQGKWAMFTQEGWMSDFTNQAVIYINFSQPIFTYALSGRFPNRGSLAKRPKSMELQIEDKNEVTAQVYVSDNCEKEYNVSTFVMPYLVSYEISTTGIPLSRSTRDVTTSIVRCFDWKDVIHSDEHTGSENISETAWTIPLFAPNDDLYGVGMLLTGNISLKLLEHKDTVTENQRWYSISHFQLHFRVHCDFYESKLVGYPTTIGQYFKFHQPGAKAYECSCPKGLSGDHCETCTKIRKFERYQREPGICANCDCSDLALSSKCDELTGQCDCGDDIDIELAGRNCYWYVSEIVPPYGPIAGGTRVTIKGGYFKGYKLEGHVLLDGERMKVSFSLNEQDIEFTTTPLLGNNTRVDLEVYVESELNLDFGPQQKFFSFQYHPNPVLTDVRPQPTIASGGVNVTVAGEFLESVYAPRMTVIAKRNRTVIHSTSSSCDLLSSTEMVCLTADLTEAVNILNTNFSDEVTADATQFSPDTHPGYLNGFNGVEFTLGFIFDGLTDYQDLSQSPEDPLRNLSRLYVYPDPKVWLFQNQRTYRVLEFDQTTEDFIVLYGENLDYVFKKTDYSVTIGATGNCHIMYLNTSRIVCRSPRRQQGSATNVSSDGAELSRVTVKAGVLTFDVGLIRYTKLETADSDLVLVTGLVVAFSLAFIIITSITLLVVQRRRRKLVKSRENSDCWSKSLDRIKLMTQSKHKHPRSVNTSLETIIRFAWYK